MTGRSIFLISLIIGLVTGCSAKLDPFAGPPVGMKMSFKPTLVNQMPAYMKTEDRSPATTMIRTQFDGRSDNTIESIEFTPSKGQVETIGWASIIEDANRRECRDSHAAALDGLTEFKDLTLICDPTSVEHLRGAILVTFNLKNGTKKQFTSWARFMSERLDKKPLEIHTFSF